MMNEPIIHVGIMEGEEIAFTLGEERHSAHYSPDFQELHFEGPFILHGVTIGKQFHWEQQEDQTFTGNLRIIADADNHCLVAINDVPLEDYLASVISSEMAATNNLELLKTHAIISRSWVLRQIAPTTEEEAEKEEHAGEIIKWWDHDDHTLFDVCADDHCQRYQGITRQVSPLVAQAIHATRGMVLTDSEGNICDARFYKACGGHTERFSACWQDRDYNYLEPTPDPYCDPEFIATLPGGLDSVLSEILNSYDQSTKDYHNWEERYTFAEISELVEHKLHLGLGDIQELVPVKRGDSGRIIRLKIVGSNKTVVIGKELLIRKALSESHLKSSWFEVDKTMDGFILRGHGWGHGVGLCQIGAAAMSIKGFPYHDILSHYFHNSNITRIYE